MESILAFRNGMTLVWAHLPSFVIAVPFHIIAFKLNKNDVPYSNHS